jgi:hypothetical protein
VFARGADFTLRHRRNANGVWSDDWQSLGGSLASPPVAVSWGLNRMDVFAVGTWDSEIWSDWESLGGSLTQTPSVVAWPPGRLDVFGLGLDAAISHFSFATRRGAAAKNSAATINSPSHLDQPPFRRPRTGSISSRRVLTAISIPKSGMGRAGCQQTLT